MTLYSQNGWVAGPPDVLHIKNYQVPGTNRHFSCNPIVAPILINFAAEFHAKIEKIDVGTYDDWGYAKPVVIPGSNVISNHGSGTAIDIDATLHPWKKAGTFKIVKVIQLHLLVKKYGIRWGGDYSSGWKDEMHFEIIETPAQCIARTIKMKLPIPKVSK